MLHSSLPLTFSGAGSAAAAAGGGFAVAAGAAARTRGCLAGLAAQGLATSANGACSHAQTLCFTRALYVPFAALCCWHSVVHEVSMPCAAAGMTKATCRASTPSCSGRHKPWILAPADGRFAHRLGQLVEAQQRDAVPAGKRGRRCRLGSRRSRQAGGVGSKGRQAGGRNRRRPAVTRCRAGRVHAGSRAVCYRAGRVHAGYRAGRARAGCGAVCYRAGAAAGAAAAKVQGAHGGGLQPMRASRNQVLGRQLGRASAVCRVLAEALEACVKTHQENLFSTMTMRAESV